MRRVSTEFTPGVDGGWAVVDNLGTLEGAETSQASQINDNGDVVGASPWRNDYSRGFLWTEQGGMVDIGSLVEGDTRPLRINNSGQVTGSYSVGSTGHAFLYTPGVGMEDLGYFAPTKKNQTWYSSLGQSGWF